jgi:hypothetical protein
VKVSSPFQVNEHSFVVPPRIGARSGAVALDELDDLALPDRLARAG